jgi:AraC-like DNA-binding protein
MDTAQIFDDVLQDLRIAGSVLLHDVYVPPWTIAVPREADLKAALGASRDVRVLPFHLVRRGSFDLVHGDLGPQRVPVGHVAICPSGAAHEMRMGGPARPVALADLLAGKVAQHDRSSPDATELLCGVFQLRETPLNPLFAALPPVVSVPVSGAAIPSTLAKAAELLGLEADAGRRAGFVTARLLEIFFAEAIRWHATSVGVDHKGWFRGVADPRVGRAIAAIHAEPARPWTVADLAEFASISPSRFAARFREAVGESVLGYVTSWRMTLACRLLSDTSKSLGEVATEVGYTDLASFGRAFKALIGTSPARWRAERR